ncbi:unnamed protein product, partial [Didymodactylos carnosus]
GGNILTWWKDRSIIYKQLSRLALSLLAIPASSATAERIFSETERILEARRQLLSSESVDSLIKLYICIVLARLRFRVRVGYGYNVAGTGLDDELSNEQ